jgi:hypothetical protein
MVGVVVSDLDLVELHSAQLFAPGGDVNRWVRRTARELKEAAQGFAPPRRRNARWPRPGTGRLNRSIKGQATWDGAKDYNIFLSAGGTEAPYATYVLGGTAYQGKRYIYTNLGWANKRQVDAWIKGREFTATEFEAGLYMPLPATGAFSQRFYMRVHGQKKNPFLTDGYTLVQKRHRALPPIRGV